MNEKAAYKKHCHVFFKRKIFSSQKFTDDKSVIICQYF